MDSIRLPGDCSGGAGGIDDEPDWMLGRAGRSAKRMYYRHGKLPLSVCTRDRNSISE